MLIEPCLLRVLSVLHAIELPVHGFQIVPDATIHGTRNEYADDGTFNDFRQFTERP